MNWFTWTVPELILLGDVTGELVYVNYARVEDITELEELGVNLTGKIAIARSVPRSEQCMDINEIKKNI